MTSSLKKWTRFSLLTLLLVILFIAGLLAGYRAGYQWGYSQRIQETPVTRVYAVGDLVLPAPDPATESADYDTLIGVITES
jgi:hypothetical protein